MPDAAYQFPPRVLRRAEAAYYVGMSLSAFDARDDKPKPVKLGVRAIGYLREDLDAMVDRIAGRPSVSAEDNLSGW